MQFLPYLKHKESLLYIINQLLFSCLVVSSCFATSSTAAHQAPPSMGSSRQEHWSGVPFPPPGDLSHPGTELVSPVSPALQWTLDLLSHWESPNNYKHCDFY